MQSQIEALDFNLTSLSASSSGGEGWVDWRAELRLGGTNVSTDTGDGTIDPSVVPCSHDQRCSAEAAARVNSSPIHYLRATLPCGQRSSGEDPCCATWHAGERRARAWG